MGKQAGESEQEWEAPQTEGRKACWSPKLQKLIGHARVGSHLHPRIVQEPRLRGIQRPLFSTNIPQSATNANLWLSAQIINLKHPSAGLNAKCC